MFGLTWKWKTGKWKLVTAMVLLAAVAGTTGRVEAQSTRRARRESNANRKERIARTIAETYGHRWELAGGGGYLRFRSGQYLKRNNEVTWAASGTYYLNPKLGVVADARGAFGNAKISNTFANNTNVFRPLINQYTFMGGVNYRVYAKEKMAASVTGMGGYAIGNFDGGAKGLSAPLLGMWPSENRPVFSAGANLDYNLYPNLAFRVSPTYVGTTFGGVVQNNLGVNMGVVYRFGKIGK